MTLPQRYSSVGSTYSSVVIIFVLAIASLKKQISISLVLIFVTSSFVATPVNLRARTEQKEL